MYILKQSKVYMFILTFTNIRNFDKIAKGDKRKFLILFEQLKEEIRKNPEMLYKDYWRKK